MTPDEILTKAADVIADEGHTKGGRYYQEGEGYCALGAMARAAGKYRRSGEPRMTGPGSFWEDASCVAAADRFAAAADLLNHGFIPDWNDTEASAEDVILAFKKAANSEA